MCLPLLLARHFGKNRHVRGWHLDLFLIAMKKVGSLPKLRICSNLHGGFARLPGYAMTEFKRLYIRIRISESNQNPHASPNHVVRNDDSRQQHTKKLGEYLE